MSCETTGKHEVIRFIYVEPKTNIYVGKCEKCGGYIKVDPRAGAE